MGGKIDWLPPGSPEAVTHGCTCPVLDNHHGSGIPMNGEILWWKSNDCPLHGGLISKETNEDDY